MSKSVKRFRLARNIPVFVEAGDETEAIIIFETAMEAVQHDGYGHIQEASDDTLPRPKPLQKNKLN